FTSYRALACDGDGTLTSRGRMAATTRRALESLRASGRQLILVTGETLKELADFPHLALFDRIVAENGAVLVHPGGEARLLAAPPPEGFVRDLREHGVRPLTLGQVIVSAPRRWQRTLHAAIRRVGIDWRVVFNRTEVMALPTEVSKATGLAAALEELGLCCEQVVGVGDGENDQALLRCCGCGAAPGNAVLTARRCADIVLPGRGAQGVVKLIHRLLEGDLPAPKRGRRPKQ
ncbi:MAG: HAD family hydrolase, partial [Gemmatimonadales bacterium]